MDTEYVLVCVFCTVEDSSRSAQGYPLSTAQIWESDLFMFDPVGGELGLGLILKDLGRQVIKETTDMFIYFTCLFIFFYMQILLSR